MIFRIRFEQKGGHVHCRLFQATAAGHTWQKCGDLTFDEDGWAAFSALANGRIDLLPEHDHQPHDLYVTVPGSLEASAVFVRFADAGRVYQQRELGETRDGLHVLACTDKQGRIVGVEVLMPDRQA